jgi:hypothetical protein
MTWTVKQWGALLKGYALPAMLPVLCGFTSTTLNPEQAEVVTSDVEHFWQAFDDAAKAPLADRAGVYAKEYFELGSEGLNRTCANIRIAGSMAAPTRPSLPAVTFRTRT